MRGQILLVLTFVLVATHAEGQHAAVDQPTPPQDALSASSVVYYAAPGVTAPQLLPGSLSIPSVRKCMPLDGVVSLSGIVDTDGFLRDIEILDGNHPGLDKLAIGLVSAEHFKPGTHDGVPSAVAITDEIGLQTCAKRLSSSDGAEPFELTLRSHPVQAIVVRPAPVKAPAEPIANCASGLCQVGDRISSPVPINYVEAEYSKYARKKKLSGVCVVGLIVDTNGMPQNVHIIKGLEPSLDQNAIEAVQKYRFKPAMKDGRTPVPVAVNFEVNFRLY
jgi:TonB family protein